MEANKEAASVKAQIQKTENCLNKKEMFTTAGTVS